MRVSGGRGQAGQHGQSCKANRASRHPRLAPPCADVDPAQAGLSPRHRPLPQLSLLRSLRTAANELLARARQVTAQALRAVDWPAAADVGISPVAAAEGDAPGTSAAPPPLAPPPRSQGERQGRRGRLASQLRALRFAAQDWVESSLPGWSLDACLLLLLLAAFAAANVLSLLCMACLAVGMAAPPLARQVQGLVGEGG